MILLYSIIKLKNILLPDSHDHLTITITEKNLELNILNITKEGYLKWQISNKRMAETIPVIPQLDCNSIRRIDSLTLNDFDHNTNNIYFKITTQCNRKYS